MEVEERGRRGEWEFGGGVGQRGGMEEGEAGRWGWRHRAREGQWKRSSVPTRSPSRPRIRWKLGGTRRGLKGSSRAVLDGPSRGTRWALARGASMGLPIEDRAFTVSQARPSTRASSRDPEEMPTCILVSALVDARFPVPAPLHALSGQPIEGHAARALPTTHWRH